MAKNHLVVPFSKLNGGGLAQLHRTYNRAFPDSPWSKKYLTAFQKNKKRRPVGYIMQTERKISGFILGRSLEENLSFLNLSTVWIGKKYRGKGLGKLLIKKFIQTAFRRKNLKKFVCIFAEITIFGTIIPVLDSLNIKCSDFILIMTRDIIWNLI